MILKPRTPPALSTKPYGGTLVVCPLGLISSWSGELKYRIERGLASHQIYHQAGAVIAKIGRMERKFRVQHSE